MEMRVDFYKLDGGRLCGWVATPPKRRSFQGTTMAAGRDIPHDLGQFVVELALGLQEGFWGLLANGATFKIRQIPSGIILGKPCVIGNGCVVDPEVLIAELDDF